MEKLNMMKNQHKEISLVINELKKAIEVGDYQSCSKLINALAGKLVLHLKYEDEHLYPELQRSNDVAVKNKAELFIKEMGGLASIFNDFKGKYNTKSKIESDLEGFKNLSGEVVKALENRLYREDNELYKLV